MWGGDALRASFVGSAGRERERLYNSDVSSFQLVPHLDKNIVVVTVNCEFIFLGTLWNHFLKKLNCLWVVGLTFL